MTWEPVEPKKPVAIGSLDIRLRWSPDKVKANYLVELLDEDNNSITRHGDLIPHLTTAERQAGMSFLNAIVAKAQALLPD